MNQMNKLDKDIEFRYIFNEVKRKVKIEHILNYYNIVITKNNFSICPFHNDTKPSMSWSKKLNLINCFVCFNKAIDCIKFVELKEQISFKEAVKFLYKKFINKKVKIKDIDIKYKINKIKKNIAKPITKKNVILEYYNKIENKIDDCYYILQDFHNLYNKRKFSWKMERIYILNYNDLEDIDFYYQDIKLITNITKKFNKLLFKDIYRDIIFLYNKLNIECKKNMIKYKLLLIKRKSNEIKM